jgi:hypothetical protein
VNVQIRLRGSFHQPFLNQPLADFVFDPAAREIAVEGSSLGVKLALDNVKGLVAGEIGGIVKFDIDLLRQPRPRSQRQQAQR